MSEFQERFIREPECKHITGLSRATRHRMQKKEKFPAPIKLNGRISVWQLSKVNKWLIENSHKGVMS